MKIRITVWLFLMLAFAWFVPENVGADSCLGITPCESFSRAKAVFIGRVLNTAKLVDTNLKGEQIEVEGGTITFSVEEAFKGISVSQISVTAISVYSPMNFARGELYVIYAYESRSYHPTDQSADTLFTSPCLRSGPVNSDHTREDIEFLRHLPKEGTGGRVYGEVSVKQGVMKPAPLTGITMILENEMKDRVEAVTDANGYYTFTGVKRGKYKVKPLLPEHFSVDRPEREVDVSDRGCAVENYWVAGEGRVSGRIVDTQGRTAPAELRLIPVVNEERDFYGWAPDDGRFSIDRVAPGRYLLYVYILSANTSPLLESKAEPYYYPGVRNRDAATIIEVGLGEVKEGYDFTLPTQLAVQTISGVVRYADGKPVAHALINLSVQDLTTPDIYRACEYGDGVTTDADGRFEIRGFKGNLYQVTAEEDVMAAVKMNRTRLYSELMTLRLNDDVNNLTLVLTTLTPSLEQMRMRQQKKQ